VKTLVIGDIHTEEKWLSELVSITVELENIAKEHKPDKIVLLGDLFSKKKPFPKEIEIATLLISVLGNHTKYIHIIEGNHDSSTPDTNSINYLKYFPRTNIHHKPMLDNNILYGHFFVDKSKYSFNHFKYTIEDLKHYRYVLLGHQHSFQECSKNVIHLGSIRYVAFNEVEDTEKKVAIIEDGLPIEYITLTSPIKMKQVNSIKELGNISSNLKIKIKYLDFDTFKNEINLLNNFKNKFVDFQWELEFKNKEIVVGSTDTSVGNNKLVLRELLNKWLSLIKDKETQSILTKELAKETF